MADSNPNYDHGSTCFGDRLKEFTQEQLNTRYFPGCGRKRRVTATITSYIGYGDPRACHYYISLKEEHNHFWDGTTWKQCWDEPDNGKILEETTKSTTRAAKLVKELFKDNFDSQTHVLIIDDMCKEIFNKLRNKSIEGD